MAGPHAGANVHPRQISHNLVWNTGTLVWDAMTQPTAGAGGDASAANQVTEIARLTSIATAIVPYTMAFEYDVDGNPIYIGKAAQGSAKSAAAWQIRKLTFSSNDVTDIQFAAGSSAYTNIWDNRALLAYS